MSIKSAIVQLLGAVLLVTVLAPSASAREPLPVGTDVDYQLGGAADRPDNVGIIARDRTETPAEGRYNICYVNGFQTQPDAKKLWRRHERLLLHRHGRLVIDGNWGEWLLDVRTKAKRKRLMKIVGPWVDGCADDGFAAVEFDNLDSFTRSHHLIKRRAGLVFAHQLVRRAHRADLMAGQKNLAGYDGTTIGFDFAVSEECARYDECGRYVDHFGDQVVMIEYRAADFRAACRDFGDTHAVVLRDLALQPSYEPTYC
ncbi:endo alpha-1,4 polygalactosaminidase [soil metagenome]